MKKPKKKRASNNFLPFSKRLLEYSRFECWIMTVALFLMQGFRIDTGELYQICLAGWAGYAVAKALYYNMAKSDHQIQLLRKIEPDSAAKIKDIIIENTEKLLKNSIDETDETIESTENADKSNKSVNADKLGNLYKAGNAYTSVNADKAGNLYKLGNADTEENSEISEIIEISKNTNSPDKSENTYVVENSDGTENIINMEVVINMENTDNIRLKFKQ